MAAPIVPEFRLHAPAHALEGGWLIDRVRRGRNRRRIGRIPDNVERADPDINQRRRREPANLIIRRPLAGPPPLCPRRIVGAGFDDVAGGAVVRCGRPYHAGRDVLDFGEGKAARGRFDGSPAGDDSTRRDAD